MRAADFKSHGKKSAIEKRRDAEQTHLREKRDQKISRTRYPEVPASADYVTKLVAQFDPKQPQLPLIAEIVAKVQRNEIDRHFMLLFGGDELPVLKKMIESSLQGNELACKALVNLTGMPSSYDGHVATTLHACQFFDRMNIQNTHHWEVVRNIALAFRAAKSELLATPLFKEPLETCGFYTALKSGNLPILIGVIYAILVGMEQEPPELFIFAIWPYLVRSLPQSLLCVSWVLQHTKNAQRLFAFADPTMLKQSLVDCSRTSPNAMREVLRCFAYLSELDEHSALPSSAFQLMKAATEHPLPAVRRNAFLWAGNYMADGSHCVNTLVEKGILQSIFKSANPSTERDVICRRNAVFAILTMFEACDRDWRENMEASRIAQDMMRTFIIKHNLPALLAPYLATTNDLVLVNDVVRFLEVALRWDREATLQSFGNAESVIDKLLSDVQGLKGMGAMELYDAAYRLQDLIEGVNRPHGFAMDMDVDEETGLAKGNFIF